MLRQERLFTFCCNLNRPFDNYKKIYISYTKHRKITQLLFAINVIISTE